MNMIESKQPQPQPQPQRLIRLPEVMDKVGLCRTSVYMQISEGRFPKPRKIGRASVWSVEEIDGWISNVIAGEEGVPKSSKMKKEKLS